MPGGSAERPSARAQLQLPADCRPSQASMLINYALINFGLISLIPIIPIISLTEIIGRRSIASLSQGSLTIKCKTIRIPVYYNWLFWQVSIPAHHGTSSVLRPPGRRNLPFQPEFEAAESGPRPEVTELGPDFRRPVEPTGIPCG